MSTLSLSIEVLYFVCACSEGSTVTILLLLYTNNKIIVICFLESKSFILYLSKISTVANLCSWAGSFEAFLVWKTKEKVSYDKAHIFVAKLFKFLDKNGQELRYASTMYLI